MHGFVVNGLRNCFFCVCQKKSLIISSCPFFVFNIHVSPFLGQKFLFKKVMIYRPVHPVMLVQNLRKFLVLLDTSSHATLLS